MADAMVYPFKKYNYEVKIDNMNVAGFSEVSATDITIDPIEYREGNMKVKTAGKQPGIVKYGNVTLKWGMTESMELYQWAQDVAAGKIERKTITITLKDDEQTETAAWQLISAWPTKYTAADMNATSNEVAIETMEFVTEGITRTK